MDNNNVLKFPKLKIKPGADDIDIVGYHMNELNKLLGSLYKGFTFIDDISPIEYEEAYQRCQEMTFWWSRTIKVQLDDIDLEENKDES